MSFLLLCSLEKKAKDVVYVGVEDRGGGGCIDDVLSELHIFSDKFIKTKTTTK